MLTWDQESGLAVHSGNARKPQQRPEACGDTSGLLQGHLLHPDLLRAKLTDGQLATNLSTSRLQR